MSRRRNRRSRSKKRSSSPKRSKKKSVKIRSRKRSSPKKKSKKKSGSKKHSLKRIRNNKRKNKRKDKRSRDKKRKGRILKKIKDRKPKKNRRTPDSEVDIDDMGDLDDYLEDEFLDEDLVEPDDIKGKNWNPGKVADHVAKQWGDRFTDDDSYKPKRLKVNAPNTPERIKKYTNKKGIFNTEEYLKDVRSSTADYAKRRGLKGSAAHALERTSAKMPKESKPKYSGAIDGLKKQLGSINYRKKIEETTDKLTKDVKPQAGKFKETGLDIIKNRSSEDGALPSPRKEKREARRIRRTERRTNRRARKQARRASRMKTIY